MPKEEPGRLLSKVAKFVRNPLKDWAELDEQDAGSADTGYSREMLKEMIERRQRNDFVRRREFDMLRKLRQREAAGSRDATPSSFSISSTTGKTAGRALTLKKIDEIEEQMSQQWWKNRQQGANGEAMTPAAMAAQQARAYADTEPGQAPPIPPDTASDAANLPRPPGIDSGLEEAAIRFAHGDDPGAEAILLQTLAPESPQADNVEIWRALLDFYRATGDFDKFSQTSMRYAQRFKKPGPEWISLRALAREVQVAGAVDPDGGVSAPEGMDWSCPQQLTRGGLAGLTQALSGAGPVWTLDWRNLSGIDAEAAGPLRALMEHWAGSPVQLRFAGSDNLLDVLGTATPTNNRNIEPVWWQLRMAILRVMNDVDGFELTALNYCITYEVSPPPWEDPAGSYAAVDVAAPLPKTSTGMSLASVRMGLGTSVEPAPAPAVAGHNLLVGELTGECHDVLHELDAELVGAEVPTVSCAALVRMDFAAAGTLLNWAMARAARGQRVEFVDVQRMLAAFFKVIGIADHASVAVRAN
ncbi:STAS domain-containing protein [Variovorax robiniae]|uniref:STAS domain-containing protein n=1 Tax=Variovorax robiniae TaxID=1836199 RepID=A0ABU8X4C2_9BURK